MLSKRCLSLLLCALFAALAFLPITTAKAADGELTVDHSTSGQLAAEITAKAGGNASAYTKLKINIGSVDLSGDYSGGDWNTLAGLTTLLPNAASLELVYKSGTHTITDYAMYMGSWLKTLIFTNDGGQLTDIGKFAFYECTGLSGTLTIPSSVTTIGTCAFYRCYGLTALSLPSTGSLAIGNSAFEGCTGLGTLTIPSSVTTIGETAFRNCSGLSGTLTISSSLTSIGSNAFWGCTGLTALSLPADGDGSFIISSGAFCGCTGLTALTIPSSVTTIGDSAFDGCTGLGTLTIPSSVTSIEGCAFRGCTGLTSLSLPDSGSLTIGYGAFEGCTGLSGTLTIPSSVTSLGIYSFDYCTGLTALVFKKAVSAPAMPSLITRQTQITAYYPETAEGSYTAQSGFPKNRAAYTDTSAIITSLNINGVRGTIDHTAKTVIVDLPAGTNLSALKPDIGFIGKSIDPVSGDAQDFSSWKRTFTITPVSGTPATHSIYIMGDPAVSGSNSLSGTVGDIGDQTATATVSAAGWPEKTTLKASIGGNEDIASIIGNGRVTFSFSSTLFEDFSVGIYPITVSADATTYNHAIAPAQAGTLTVKPAVPVIKTATAGDTSITITWDAVSGADGYKVYSYDPNTKAYTEIASTTTGTSYTQSGLAAGTTYYYAVSSYQTVSGSPICSNYSEAASAATPAPPVPPADPPKPEDPPTPPADQPKPEDPPADPPANQQAPAPTPAPATLPHVGTFPANKVLAKANAGTVITIVPTTAPKGYTMQSVSYSSSNPSVATVDANGNVTFLAGGKVTIVTKMVSQMTDKKGRIITKTTTVKKTVTVKQPVASISLNQTSATVARTQKVKLIVQIGPATASNKKLTWKSSNPKVAAVSSAGVVTAKAGGTAIITCTAKDGSGISASCTVMVTPVYPTALKLNKSALTIKTGKTAALKATVAPKNTDFKTVTWASSNPAVVSVDAKGKIKALASGTAVVTATTSNGITASCTVTIQ